MGNSNKLTALRQSLSLRQIDLAIKADVSPGVIVAAEHGKRVSMRTRRKIATALGVTTAEIFGGDA